MNSSGKTLTVFLIVIAVLLISLTAIAVFFFLKEVEVRKALEYNLEQMQVKEVSLKKALEEAKKEIFLYEEQKKETSEEIESLQGELDLVQGLREEIKKENRKLMDELETDRQTNQALKEDLEEELAKAKEKIEALLQENKTTVSRNKELDAQRNELKERYQLLLKQIKDLGEIPVVEQMKESLMPEGGKELSEQGKMTQEAEENVELGKIVVKPKGQKQGKIISVDKETDFVIINLGEEDGLKKDAVLSIYRGENYIGDIKVSRVLPEMSAADFVPPLKNHQVREDDQVIIK